MKKLLDGIKSPEDLKKLSLDELKALCVELRSFLIENVSKTGGHIASNLGVVELTVAILSVFNMPHDKIIFDVGHQSYIYKILTGRAERFSTLRQFDGLSGFPKRNESEYDAFNTGHSSTSISAALGLARARDLKGDNANIIALFGDGALTGGMMYEAMNDAGHRKTPLILILNDNKMSITENVGSVSAYLQRLRVSPRYFKSKQIIETILNCIPVLGKALSLLLRKIKRRIRRLVLPTTMFDDLGFTYMGPVDGHDLDALISCFKYVKNEKKPVLIHVMTKKGKGYAPAEKHTEKFHGIGPFDVKTGETKETKETYSSHFGDTLLKLAKENDKVVAITGAMTSGTGLEAFSADSSLKNRFFDVGIAEQHGVTMAAGLAAGGYIPVIPLYSSFLQRAYDQTLHDVCLQNLHVVFPIDRAGVVGADGETHQGLYDISYLSHMPNMKILSPANFKQLDMMLDYAINSASSPVAIRYPRGSSEFNFELSEFDINKAITIRSGNDISIIAAGRMVIRAVEVADELLKHGINAEVIQLASIKPIDKASILATAMKTNSVITIEDNVKIGGMGQMVAAILEEYKVSASLKIFAFGDEPVPHGTVDELDALYGLDKNTIVKEVLNGKDKT